MHSKSCRTRCERPPEVALHDPAIQADFRASGDRLLDQDQQQKRLDFIRVCVSFVLQYNLQKQMGSQKNCFSIKTKGTEVDERAAEVYSEQGHYRHHRSHDQSFSDFFVALPYLSIVVEV